MPAHNWAMSKNSRLTNFLNFHHIDKKPNLKLKLLFQSLDLSFIVQKMIENVYS